MGHYLSEMEAVETADEAALRVIRNQVDCIAAGGLTKRFHTVDTVRENTVAAHSFGVAWFCWVLRGGIPSAELLIHALAHDLPECEVGDVPAPTKRQNGIGALMDAMETEVLMAAGITLPALDVDDARVLKIADCLDGYLFCVMEVRRGNRGIALSALPNFARYAHEQRTSMTEHERRVLQVIQKMHKTYGGWTNHV